MTALRYYLRQLQSQLINSAERLLQRRAGELGDKKSSAWLL